MSVGRKKLRDQATEADWSFTQDERLMEALEKQVRFEADRDGLDPDDLLQETLLWLAVRPAAQRLDLGLILNKVRSVTQKERNKDRRQRGVEVAELVEIT